MDYVNISYAGIDVISIIHRKAALSLSSFSSLKLTNFIISNSAEIGMFVKYDVVLTVFENNRFKNNAGLPIIITAGQLHKLDTVSQFGTTNTNSFIEVLGHFSTNEKEVTWNAFDDYTPCYLSG